MLLIVERFLLVYTESFETVLRSLHRGYKLATFKFKLFIYHFSLYFLKGIQKI